MSAVTLAYAREYLQTLCGYSEDLLCADFQFEDNRIVPLAAFAHKPTDARSACLAVIATEAKDAREEVLACRPLGAPVVIALKSGNVEFWRQGRSQADLVDQAPSNRAKSFLRSKAKDLSPTRVFRAKTWGRLDRQYQLSFVDTGLMPLIEEEAGSLLTELIGCVYGGLLRSLYSPKQILSPQAGHWMVKSAFWLLAAKILRDKRVPSFIRMDLDDVDDVFARVGRHYDSGGQVGLAGVKVRTMKQRKALRDAAAKIDCFGDLALVTTESLSHVYESALISKAVRKELGTHSTPQYLVDYVVWKLAPWIREIPEDQRDVFEPASGHAAFLVSAMRLLKEELDPERQDDRKRYLRQHVHGLEIDPFAVEVARLSLTLADIPNSNGWDLTSADMFAGSILAKKASKASIFLGNPPFENFTARDKRHYAKQGNPVHYNNKTTEVLSQILPQVPIGGVFGFVVPQGILHGKDAADLRVIIRRDFEIQEICRLPDKVFTLSDAESAVILGRRVDSPLATHRVSFRNVWDGDLQHFKLDYAVSSRQDVRVCDFPASMSDSLRLPEMCCLWAMLSALPTLDSLADTGKGFEFKGKALPGQASTESEVKFRGATPGFSGFGTKTQLHELPKQIWLNLDPAVIRCHGTGTTIGQPQVLLNYARVSRGPWRLKALIDAKGHPVTSRFITVRPHADIPLEYLWAILNSPLANAYAFSNLAKRDILVGVMRKMPVPIASIEDMDRIVAIANKYFDEIHCERSVFEAQDDWAKAKDILLSLDAEVLRLYDLSPKLERQLLDLFSNRPRLGVPFTQDCYFPEAFEPYVHFYEYLSEGFRNSDAKIMLEARETFASKEVSDVFRRAKAGFAE